MNIARFTPLRISSSGQEFILNFSLLEHDLIHFFKIRDFDHAISRINKFKEVHPINCIDAEILNQLLLGLIGSLTAASYTHNLNLNDFLKLRLYFFNFIKKSPCTSSTFWPLSNDIITTYFNLLDNFDFHVSYQNLSKQVALTAYYISAHPQELTNSHGVLHTLNLNNDYTQKLFKKELGFSINAYIQHIKLSEAKRLLLQRQLSVGKIASLLHFYDTPTFSKTFKKAVGLSPLKYRELNYLSLKSQSY
ncbi:helix-turn-helix transcriptional regulator [Lactiplantibacillus plantarum]|uniref:helix-turn-helix transcriptional regulator n=1 Tax=Lactiplantibacillus plantarum TaxID=1590 RepID=UPI001374865E|nr:helix-turn-helix transcriptional regulator [Lactiplantibacillus plantarum]QHM45113.1 Xylose operon regulatory protein [Lactiplantibacillus plantarum]